MTQVNVEIRIRPLPSEIPVEELDQLFGGEVTRFETWFLERQRAAGLEASALISAERAIVHSFLHYLATKPEDG